MISFRSLVGRERVGSRPVDAVRGSGPVGAIRFRFPPPTCLPYDDLELGAVLLRWRASSRCRSAFFWCLSEGQKWNVEVVKRDGRRYKQWDRELVMGGRPQGLK